MPAMDPIDPSIFYGYRPPNPHPPPHSSPPLAPKHTTTSATNIPIDPSLLDVWSSTTSNMSPTIFNPSVGSTAPAISTDTLLPVMSVLKTTSNSETKTSAPHSPKGHMAKPKHKAQEEFTTKDLNQLL
ncbi:hypothetical protein K439DRAFT_1616461 [Ramaria rubella]|nr:hypothetical protein K439DRAFT_1616461 [Ramaria rubella]